MPVGGSGGGGGRRRAVAVSLSRTRCGAPATGDVEGALGTGLNSTRWCGRTTCHEELLPFLYLYNSSILTSARSPKFTSVHSVSEN